MNEKFCSECGEALIPEAKFCPGCGRKLGQTVTAYVPPQVPVYTPPVVNQPPFQPPVMQNISKKQYRKICTDEKYLKGLKSNSIALYILTVLNAVIAIGTNPWALIDTGIYLVLTLGMHLGKNKACAIGVLLYAIFCICVTMATTGNFGGWLWLVIAISAIRNFSIADKEYKELYGG